jgi:transposase InsO family protein
MAHNEEKAPLQSNQEAEEALRNRAIDLFIGGKKAEAISRELGRSQVWFYKTLARYEQSGREGLKSQNRAPKRVHNRTNADIEGAVVRVRQTILQGEDVALRYASIGANTIASELKRAGIEPPSRRTINRILVRHQLVEPRPAGVTSSTIPDDYPWPRAEQANAVHLFDFVMRSIAGGGRFYSCNLMDHYRRWPFLRIIVNKRAESVAQFLVEAWQAVGLPTALYLDNDVVWRGSGSAKRTLSRIIRLALLLGVECIFTPPYTPKANPLIESFNSLWNSNFWLRHTFAGVTEVETELPHFEYTARYRHPWPACDLRTADQIAPDFKPCCLATDFAEHLQPRLPLTAGRLHFIRFVDADGSFAILNERWSLDAHCWAGKTIRATIELGSQQLLVFHQTSYLALPNQIAAFDFPLDEAIVPLRTCFQRPHLPLWPATS